MDELEIMQKGDSFEQLKENVLLMVGGEDIASNDSEKVSLHELENKIKILFIASPEHMMQFNDIGMTDFSQNLDFSVSSLCIDIIPKCSKYFFEGK